MDLGGDMRMRFLYQKSELLDKAVGLAENGEVQIVVQEVIKGILEGGKDPSNLGVFS